MTWLGAAIVGISAFVVAQSCVVQHQTGRLDCSRSLEGLHSKWLNAFITCAIAGFFTAIFTCIARGGARCGSSAVRSAQTIVASVASAVCVTLYAHFARLVLANTPTPDNSYGPTGEVECVVCTQSETQLYYSVMYGGVGISWIGIAVVAYTSHTVSISRSRALTQRLTDEPNDAGRHLDRRTDSVA